LFLYSDIDSLLWLQKQYKNTDENLKIEINSKTKICFLNDKNISLNFILSKYNIKEILKLIFEIPMKS
jgi:hypothetical protein